MTDPDDLSRIVERGERRRWPIYKTRVALPEPLVPDLGDDCFDWRPSQVLAFDDDGRPTSRFNASTRHSESVPLGETQNADLWVWLKQCAGQQFARWRELHPDYLPGPLDLPRGQLIRYRPGHFFTAHSDFSAFTREDRYRVLICVIGMSQCCDYQGGGLRFETCSVSYKLDRGDGLVYPAALLHEVEPVTAGCRITMLAEAHAALTPLQLQRYIDQFQHEAPTA